MISRITMNGVNSFERPAILETNNKVNLIYGLNGVGKSTLSNYLYDRDNPIYKDCSIEGLTDETILVYNQQFINDYFYEPDGLKGIFTLSKENKAAELKIKEYQDKLERLEAHKERKNQILRELNDGFKEREERAQNIIWEIKTKYAGGDRVLEYCLKGYMRSKSYIFNHILAIGKPETEPSKTVEQLKKEVEALSGETSKKYPPLPLINFNVINTELEELLKKTIVGNEDSAIADLITRLGNSDWVKEGLGYLPEELIDEWGLCPFCQQQTVNQLLIDNIKDYFDETYTNDIKSLEKFLLIYGPAIQTIPAKETYQSNPFVKDETAEFENLYNSMMGLLGGNKSKIETKIKTPGKQVVLDDTKVAIKSINDFIARINAKIKDHNGKLDNKDAVLEDVKSQFWRIMRWDYDQTIARYKEDRMDFENKESKLKQSLEAIDDKLASLKEKIGIERKNTVNIDEAIIKINKALFELGITGFEIVKHSENHYKLAREKVCDHTFKTLSEGEKMVVSFLYFCELCKGEESAVGHPNKKIIVIDDPISSLSHIYVYNVAQLIKKIFLGANSFKQVILLTHSLYFFYEMVPKRKNERARQKYFRMFKNGDGSQIVKMDYNEIQNDYQAYWSIIKDDAQPPALIANCMRNIIEYFFGFIDKNGLNEVFRADALKDNKYQAFLRYINRESHSDGTNIFDWKEFDYAGFKEAFKLVFVENGYEEHYKTMMG